MIFEIGRLLYLTHLFTPKLLQFGVKFVQILLLLQLCLPRLLLDHLRLRGHLVCIRDAGGRSIRCIVVGRRCGRRCGTGGVVRGRVGGIGSRVVRVVYIGVSVWSGWSN